MGRGPLAPLGSPPLLWNLGSPPCLDCPPSRRLIAGDLFTALLLARLHRQPDCLGAALEAAVASLQAVLRDTAAEAGDAVAQTLRTAEVGAGGCPFLPARPPRLPPAVPALRECPRRWAGPARRCADDGSSD